MMDLQALRKALRHHHGDAWERIEAIVRGGAATSPADMVRARYSAMALRDPKFLAETEVDGRPTAQRVEKWIEVMGLNSDAPPAIKDVSKVAKLDIVRSEGLLVDYIVCFGPDDEIRHKGTFREHPEYGFVFVANAKDEVAVAADDNSVDLWKSISAATAPRAAAESGGDARRWGRAALGRGRRGASADHI